MFLSLSLPGGVLAQQSDEAQLYLRLGPFQEKDVLYVDIFLTNVTNLYGVEIQLQYDPDQLTVRDQDHVTSGHQIILSSLLSADDRLVFINSADPKTGLIRIATTLLNPAPPVNEEGVLASIIFDVKEENTHPITVKVVNVKLIANDITQIPVVAHDLILDVNGGTPIAATPQSTVDPSATMELGVTVTPTTSPISTSTMTWVGFTALGIGLVLVMVIVLVLWRSQPATTPLKPAVRKMPGATFSAGRSSALLIRQGNEAMARSDFETAYEYFSQAVELDPANAEAWLGKGLVAQQESEKKICLHRALSLDPENQTAKMALKQI